MIFGLKTDFIFTLMLELNFYERPRALLRVCLATQINNGDYLHKMNVRSVLCEDVLMCCWDSSVKMKTLIIIHSCHSKMYDVLSSAKHKNIQKKEFCFRPILCTFALFIFYGL